jgi:hypothetical protein
MIRAMVALERERAHTASAQQAAPTPPLPAAS